MKRDKLDSLSLLMIEAYLLRKINFDDIMKDFARKNNYEMHDLCILLTMKDKLQKFCELLL